MSGLEVRLLDAEECEAAMRTFSTAMQFGAMSPEVWATARERAYPERSIGAFDRGRLVGHVKSFPFLTVVPGGARVPTAGVSAVGTLPTHRRRGILTTVMNAHLRHVRATGEPLASLRASEGPIYGRFGYGVAGLAADVEINTRTGGGRERLTDPGSFHYASGPEVLDIVVDVHTRSLRRPGEVVRPIPLHRRALGPVLTEGHSDARWVVVHHDRRGRPDGYADWEALDRHKWGDERTPTIEVGDVAGVDDSVDALLWQFLLDLDLVHVIKAGGRPVDDPLRWRLADPRAYRTTSVWDEQWLRVVDVPTALAARTYGPSPTSVVLEVIDPVLPDNDGRYEISAEEVHKVRRAPDLVLPIEVLGAVYLGGPSFVSLVAAGRIEERRRGAALVADRLFHSALAPWCGTFF